LIAALTLAVLAGIALMACGTDLAEDARVSVAGDREPATISGVAIPADDPTTVTSAFVSAAVPGRPLPHFWAGGPMTTAGAAPPPPNIALAAIVMDEASGTVLYEKDAHRQLAPASLTKIATAILAAESGRWDETFTVDVDSRTMRGSTIMGLIPGDRFTLGDLVHGLMLPSGNDAGLAIGRALAGSDAAFVESMNMLSRRLGLTDTNWANPHGLGGINHYTTAYDLAILSRYYMSFPELRDVAAKGRYSARGDRTISFGTLNPLFGYQGVDGLKTGYTRGSGNTFVMSRVKDGHRIFVVLLNDSNRAADGWALSNWAFASHHWPEPIAAHPSSGPPPSTP
jgi:serine-type D-Ala-D-Ala carboxypeptidase (penicillin-binding protein 5/6)